MQNDAKAIASMKIETSKERTFQNTYQIIEFKGYLIMRTSFGA